jgi:hypothetical protein
MADAVGLGKTIQAGLLLAELSTSNPATAHRRLQAPTVPLTSGVTVVAAAQLTPKFQVPSASDFLRLRDAYRLAKTTIEGFDGLERDVGLASLRLEAVEAYKQFHSTGAGLRDADTAILKNYVDSLLGGEGVETSVAWLEARVKQLSTAAFSAILGYLLTGVVAAIVLAVAGVVFNLLAAVLSGIQAAVALILSSSAAMHVVYRLLQPMSSGGQKLWIEGWGWASSLGKRSDAALAEPRRLGLEMWTAMTGTPWQPKPFTTAARGNAQGIVGFTWAVLLVGAGVVAVGALRVFGNN